METKSSNTVQIFWVILGNVMAFAFSIVSSMLLSRYFDKQEYGTYKQVMYVYSTLLIVFTLGLPKAYSYFLPRVSPGQAKDLINKINVILLLLGLIMSLSLFAGATTIAHILKNELLIQPIRYFSLVPLFMLPTMGLEGILSTYKQTKFLAIYNTLTKVFMLLCVVLPVIIFHGGVDSAIVGFTVSSFLCFLMALFLKYYPIKEFKKEKSPYTYREIFRFTIPLMGASIWGIIISSSDQFFISRYFGNEVFADFANGSLELPFVGMIIAATSTVLSPVFSKYIFENGERSKDEIILLWRSVLGKTVKLIYPLVVFCFCFADVIMVLLYGDKYHDSGAYFQIKLIVNFFTVIAYSSLMLAIGGEKYYFKVHMFGAVFVVVLEWVAASIFKSSYLVTAVSVICQIARITMMLLFISKYFKIRIIDLFPIKLIANIVLPSLLFLYLLKFGLGYLEINKIVLITLALLLYITMFGAWAYYRKIDYLSIFKPLLNKIKR